MSTSIVDNYSVPTESLLGFADDTNLVLRERLLAAYRFTLSWIDAVTGSSNFVEWVHRITDLQNQILESLLALPVDGVFPTNTGVDKYEATSHAWAELWRDLQLSADTLPRPDLLTVLGSYVDSVVQAPFAASQHIVEQVAQSLGKALGGTVAAIWRSLWPLLLIGGAAGVAYVFRAPLGRLLGKVAK